MAITEFIKRAARGMTVAAALLTAAATVTAPEPARAISPGAAVGIGLGSFALGTALANPYWGYPYSYPYYYPPTRSCWDPYAQRYYQC